MCKFKNIHTDNWHRMHTHMRIAESTSYLHSALTHLMTRRIFNSIRPVDGDAVRWNIFYDSLVHFDTYYLWAWFVFFFFSLSSLLVVSVFFFFSFPLVISVVGSCGVGSLVFSNYRTHTTSWNGTKRKWQLLFGNLDGWPLVRHWTWLRFQFHWSCYYIWFALCAHLFFLPHVYSLPIHANH